MKYSLYHKTKVLRSGMCLNISLLYPCNLACPYCSLEMPIAGVRPGAGKKILKLDDWKPIVKNFPTKIREVFLTGGEPTMLKWLPDFVNWLLDEGYHVCIFSNLHNPELLMKCKRSYRLQIRASFHLDGGENVERFDKAYKMLIPYYDLNVDELCGDYTDNHTGKTRHHDKMLPYSISKQFADMAVLQTTDDFRYSPDGNLFTSCYDRYKAG